MKDKAKIAELLREIAAIIDDAPVENSPSTEPRTKTVTIEEVRGVLTRLSRQGHTDQVHKLIVSFGAEKLSGVAPEKYADLLSAAQEIANAL